MHYKNGREAKAGDQIIGRDWNGNAIGGVVVELNAQSTTCNGRVISAQQVWGLPVVTLSDCLHVDDALPQAAK